MLMLHGLKHILKANKVSLKEECVRNIAIKFSNTDICDKVEDISSSSDVEHCRYFSFVPIMKKAA